MRLYKVYTRILLCTLSFKSFGKVLNRHTLLFIRTNCLLFYISASGDKVNLLSVCVVKMCVCVCFHNYILSLKWWGSETYETVHYNFICFSATQPFKPCHDLKWCKCMFISFFSAVFLVLERQPPPFNAEFDLAIRNGIFPRHFPHFHTATHSSWIHSTLETVKSPEEWKTPNVLSMRIKWAA